MQSLEHQDIKLVKIGKNMKTKFDQVIFETAITIDPETLKNKLNFNALSPKEKEGLNAMTGAIENKTETDAIQKDFEVLSDEKSSDEQKTQAMLRLISQKRLPNITQKKEDAESQSQNIVKKEKPTQSSLTYSAPSFQ